MAPNPGVGGLCPRRARAFLPPSAAGISHAAACGDVPPPGGGGKRGQDTKVSYPLLRLPNFPLRRSAEHSRLKCEESTDFISVLSSFFMP